MNLEKQTFKKREQRMHYKQTLLRFFESCQTESISMEIGILDALSEIAVENPIISHHVSSWFDQ